MVGNCPVGDRLAPPRPSPGAFCFPRLPGWGEQGRASLPHLGAVPCRAGLELLGLLARAGRAGSC